MNPTRLAASLFAATLPLLGCQFIFGINEYETGEGAGAANPSSSGGNAGENAGGSGLGGRGGSGPGPGSGGGGEGGSGGSNPDWTFVRFDGAGTGVAPTACVGGTALNLFGGSASVNCSACTTSALAGSCAPPSLICFDNNTCGGGMNIVTPTAQCEFYGTYDSCRIQGQVGPAVCDAPIGGAPGPAELPNYAAFCESCEECTARGAECAVYAASGTAATCDTLEGYSFAYTLFESTDGEAACDSCAIATQSCNGVDQPFLVGPFPLFCSGCDTVVSDTCSAPFGGTPCAKSNVSSNCATNHPEPYPGSFAPSGTARTVCCKEALPPTFDLQQLAAAG